MGRCRIAPRILERFEADAALAEIMKDIEQVAGRASLSVFYKFRNIPGTEITVAFAAARHHRC